MNFLFACYSSFHKNDCISSINISSVRYTKQTIFFVLLSFRRADDAILFNLFEMNRMLSSHFCWKITIKKIRNGAHREFICSCDEHTRPHIQPPNTNTKEEYWNRKSNASVAIFSTIVKFY